MEDYIRNRIDKQIEQDERVLDDMINSIKLGTEFKHKKTWWKITEFDSFIEDFVDEDTGEVVSIERKFLNKVENLSNKKKESWNYNKLLGLIIKGEITQIKNLHV